MSITPTFAKAGAIPRISQPPAPGFLHLRTKVATFKSNGVWKSPANVRSVPLIRGFGATLYFLNVYQTITRYKDTGGGGSQTSVVGPDLVNSYQISPGDAIPTDYCDPPFSGEDWSGTIWDSTTVCYSFSVSTLDSNSTGLGKTFPPGAATSFNNVAVTPSTNYSIVVPTGGQLDIYYR
jgi:hypothetical protein